MRALSQEETNRVTGGVAPLIPIATGATIGGLTGSLEYAYDSSMDGSFTWSGLTASFLQGAVTGALVATGGYFVTVSGGIVVTVTTESLATIIQVVDPAGEMQ